MPYARVVLLVALGALFIANPLPAGEGDIPPQVRSTQDPEDVPLSPSEAVKRIRVPEGFQVTLFAGEPDVAQPIAFALDDRGRLWVAECYSYKEWKAGEGHDRILIFEDTDGDGRFDERKIFADGIANLTGLQLGFGGVWILSAPHLLFIPDRDADDVPDGKPVVELDGWTLEARHNIVNNLEWGPDGWLYGMHGILHESVPRRPGKSPDDDSRIRCGVWRYHPTRKVFEVVAHGTTNPWGLAWDEYGEGFFTNCVIDHLWHVVPGAHYRRMYGQDYNPFLYDLMGAASDHIHWAGGNWTESRGGGGAHNLAGGGHAHCGAMIYLGDNWPQKYRGRLFTCNVHGRRVNSDLLERHGSGYTGRHAEDVVFSDDIWFRGVTIKYGPDGAVFISDWSDLGECHDNDGVHRTSGRIFKVTYGTPQPVGELNLAKLDDKELVELQRHANDWHVRRARLLLQARAASGKDMSEVHAVLRAMFEKEDSPRLRLCALWTLEVTGGTDEPWLIDRLADESEHVRSWAVRLLCEARDPPAEAREKFVEMARNDPSALVKLYLAAMLQRMPVEARWPLAEALVTHAAEQADHNLRMMIWYGIEPAVAAEKSKAVRLLGKCEIPRVREFIAKRLAEAIEE